MPVTWQVISFTSAIFHSVVLTSLGPEEKKAPRMKDLYVNRPKSQLVPEKRLSTIALSGGAYLQADTNGSLLFPFLTKKAFLAMVAAGTL